MKRRSSRARWLLFSGALALFLELGARGFWWSHGVTGLDAPSKLYLAYYPELADAQAARLDADTEFNVLLLGGSIVSDAYGAVGSKLAEALSFGTRREVRVHRLAAPAHTTRDSLFKLRRLAEQRYDLVVVYHGINEVRANNCPPEVFRADYSHYAWYGLVDALSPEPNRLSVLPYTARCAWFHLSVLLGRRSVLPQHAPDHEWARFGGEVKTTEPFRTNLEAICEIARSQGTPVVLMTVALHVPDDYARSKFARRELDYSLHTLPLETWGEPAHVSAGVAAHNSILRDLAATRDGVYLVDQDALMPRGAQWFNDACHFTHAGSARFVALLTELVRSSGLGPEQRAD